MRRASFRLKVESTFQFLETEYGFALSQDPDGLNDRTTEAIVYERLNSKVTISCSIRDGWGLEILMENSAFGEYSLHTYLRLVDVDTARKLGYSLAATDDELFELMDIYSDAMKSSGSALLVGEASAWTRLQRAEELGEGLTESNDVSARFCHAPESPSWE